MGLTKAMRNISTICDRLIEIYNILYITDAELAELNGIKKQVRALDYESFVDYVYSVLMSKYNMNITKRKTDKEKPFLWLKVILAYIYYGNLQDPDFYINIDEAQDYASIELKLLSLINGNATINAYGDLNQRIFVKHSSPFYDIFEDENIHTLNQNYRNTIEIVEYVNKELSLNVDALGFNGPSVIVSSAENFNSCFDEEIKRVDKQQIVLIYKNSVSNKFNELIDNILKRHNFYKNSINIYEINEVRGMEFRTAFIFNDFMSKEEKYIAYTRALEQLYIIQS
jgi:DNA helicase IV